MAGYLQKKRGKWEVIVVDDGSRDGTAETVEHVARDHPAIRLLRLTQNRGKGEAVKQGVQQARYDVCLFMDADNATKIEEWDKFEGCFDSGFDAVIASRHLPASEILHPQPFARRFLGGGYRFLCRSLFGLSASDLNCGFKAYRTSLAKQVYAENRMNDWTFDIETLCRLKKQGVKFAEVPVSWAHQEKKSGIAPLRAAFKTFGSLWRLKRGLR